jgi:hypothetical protein
MDGGGGGTTTILALPLLLISSLLALGAPAQDLTASFDISRNHTQREFVQFIADARAALRVPDRPFVVQDAGRLPPQEDVPRRFMDLELRTADYAVTIRMRVDNLYVIGFRTASARGRGSSYRWPFGPPSPARPKHDAAQAPSGPARRGPTNFVLVLAGTMG